MRWKFVIGILFVGLLLAACQSAPAPATVEAPGASPEGQTAEAPSTEAQTTEAAATEPPAEKAPADPAAIEADWKAGPHSDTFVLTESNENTVCARCHSPVNYIPTMEDIPPSCFSCKFEIKPPPPMVAQEQWQNIQCNVCHEIKKKKVSEEISWLEVPQIEQYAEVASNTELCLKCHTKVDVEGHEGVVVEGDCQARDCTDCHDAHNAQASCTNEACHADFSQPATPIAGHDADHQNVSCVACHDGSQLEVGPDANGVWTTFRAEAGADGKQIPFTSHNFVKESACERCHFTGNPWDLKAPVTAP
jgi:hypothetical protein